MAKKSKSKNTSSQKKKNRKNGRKLLMVLDTNVLIHDPNCIFRFQEHDVFIPRKVIQELDNNKQGTSEKARNARTAARHLNNFFISATIEDLKKGIPITSIQKENSIGGKIFLQTEDLTYPLPEDFPKDDPDNIILSTVLGLQKKHPNVHVIFVCNDIIARLKAVALGISVEYYENDRVIDDASLLHKGQSVLPENFWDENSEHLTSWKKTELVFYEISGPIIKDWFPNQFLILKKEDDKKEHYVVESISKDKKSAVIKSCKDYTSSNSVYGIKAKNPEQNFALNLLMDTNIDIVILLGVAGTGKTLLALAAALEQVIEQKIYRDVVVTRITVPMGKDIGFLPGTEEEKMSPWMGAIMDNLEVLTNDHKDEWEFSATNDFIRKYIQIKSINFMRGRTFFNKFIIVDESQNLTPRQIKALVTRAGQGTKMVFLGNLAQIDTPYITETNSGLTHLVERYKQWEHSGHIILPKGERSRLADSANDLL